MAKLEKSTGLEKQRWEKAQQEMNISTSSSVPQLTGLPMN